MTSTYSWFSFFFSGIEEKTMNSSSSNTCTKCFKKFVSIDKLLQHEVLCNSLVLCNECGMNINDPHHHHEERCLSEPAKKKIRVESPIPLEWLSSFNNLCSFCGKTFNNQTDREKHEKRFHIRSYCTKCGLLFESNPERVNHEINCETSLECEKCGVSFTNVINYNNHSRHCKGNHHSENHRGDLNIPDALSMAPGHDGISPYESAFNSRLASYFIRSDFTLDLPLFLEDVKPKVVRLLTSALHLHTGLKFHLVIDCLMENTVGDEMDSNLKVRNEILMDKSDIDGILERMFEKLETELSELETKKSGWQLAAIYGLRLKINKYSPMRGGSYIPLPPKIKNKKACLNVVNDDEYCFKYAVLGEFVRANRHPDRVAAYKPFMNQYKFDCIQYPPTLKDVRVFEKVNNISINIFILDENDKVCPKKIVDQELLDHRDLLLLEIGEKRHFVYIKNFDKLVHSQITSDHGKIKVCKRCLWYKKTDPKNPNVVREHDNLCNKNQPAAVILPTQKPYIKFEHVERSMKIPFVVYADFESQLYDVHTCQPDPERSYEYAYNKHSPISVCAYLHFDEEFQLYAQDLPSEPFIYRGSNAVTELLNFLNKVAEGVSKVYDRDEPLLPLTPEESHQYQTASLCYLCEKPFSEPMTDPKVLDHCHITGFYRGPAHNSCNLRYRVPKILPVFFHNMSGYDGHFIIPELGYNNKEINIIPSTSEKYTTFSKKINHKISLRFLDSYKFLSSGLDDLSSNLKDFPISSRFFNKEEMELAKRKGVFPYEFMNSDEKYELTQLPSKDDFYSKLRQSHISDEEYAFAKNVWEVFKCKTMGDYNDLYMKIDVLLLADVMQAFRSMMMKSHKLDPAHYVTLPAMSWDAMLRSTKVQLDLLTDYDMILMIESGIRGGLCQVSQRYAKANNPSIPGYNPTQKTTYITYQDCNALYATVMSKPLPFGEFIWINVETLPDDINEFLEPLKEDDEYGFLLEVDIEYPDTLHDEDNDLPFFPEKLKQVSGKLVAHLGARKNYVVHYMILKQAIDHGLIIKDIHRVLKFQQSTWLQDYIELNNNLRKDAITDFEKDLFKLLNNAIYGKTLQSVRKYRDIRLVTKYEQAEKLIAKESFINSQIFKENLIAVEMARTSITFDKPIYIGQAILDISKMVMYHYLYNVMKKIYPGDQLSLLYMDTDSFIMEICTENFYRDMNGYMKENYLDTSNYPLGHPLKSDKNKKALGKFKDEVGGKLIKQFVGLRPKMYALDVDTENEIENNKYKRAKGIQRCVVEKKIKFNDYINCLQTKHVRRDFCTGLRSKNHVIHSVFQNKISLSPHDDKRHILDNGITTLALNHKSLRS